MKPGDTICIRSWMWNRNTTSAAVKRTKNEHKDKVFVTKVADGYAYIFVTYPQEEAK